MAAASQVSGPEYETLESQIRECFGRVAYSHKTQEKEADSALWWRKFWSWSQIILSAINTTGFIVIAFGEPKTSRIAAIISGVLSAVLVAVSSFIQGNDLGQLSEKHKATASALWGIRESYLSLLTDMACGAIALEAARQKRDELKKQLEEIYATAPRTTSAGYMQASKGLKESEELTFSDEEIDKFLPLPLKRAKNLPNLKTN